MTTMLEAESLLQAAMAGAALGGIFFVGLWWTVQLGTLAKNPAPWFLVSLLLRVGGDPGRVLLCRGSRLASPGGLCRGICRRESDRDRCRGCPLEADPAGLRRSRMHLSPDQIIFWQHGFLKLNATIAFTWALMLLLAVGSLLITRNLSLDLQRSRWQNLLEIVVTGIKGQIEEVGLARAEKYLGFLGTLFLFIAASSICTIIPGYQPPTGSLSTTAALALCVLVAVPMFGIEEQGLGGYLKSYAQPRC